MLDSVLFPLQYISELYTEQEWVEHLQHAVKALLEGNSAFLYTICDVSDHFSSQLKNSHIFLPFFFRIKATFLWFPGLPVEVMVVLKDFRPGHRTTQACVVWCIGIHGVVQAVLSSLGWALCASEWLLFFKPLNSYADFWDGFSVGAWL